MKEQRPDNFAGKIISEEEFESLFISYYETLCNVAFQLTSDRYVAEDLVQDFFYNFWAAHRDKVFSVSFIGYAYRAVKNRAINYVRNNKSSPVKDDADVESLDQQAWQDGRDEKEAKEILLLRLEREIDNLPAVRRKIFLLNNKEGLKYKEIAEALGISVNTVKTQLRLAYGQLRDNCLLLLIIFLIKSLQFLHPFFHFRVF